ncbi:aminomethyltransferase/hypothetical protein [Bryocella elongata]|uniref:GCVT N-terminal domain-containing protein n=1 Tax=Bryocella elongata TaxID=863522 RepID=A0A1H6B928_9BACT|nr:folate-binding protein YgfZ [Bryocella elongata]SEG56666.1 aminomethyltransferase/hypothetical protein [Bryocella elongata]
MTSISSTDLDAIRHHAAYALITDRAFLRITGSDATRWLNGMVTNNIKDLKPGEGNYNFLLNAQGRIQADAMIYREPGEGDPTYLLETDNSQLETVNQHLDKFIIMDDVELTPALTDKTGVLVVGPGALASLDVGNAWPTTPVSISPARDIFGDPTSIDGDPLILSVAKNHYEFWGDHTTLDWIRSIGDPEASPEALEAHRILSGIPKYGTDIRNTETAKDLPQETGQTHALHFSKGCYLGQEIVERIHSRGQVHRIFSKFTLTGAPAALPTPLTVDGKTAGELTSAVEVDGQWHALGYLRREFAAKPLSYEGGTASAK